MHSLTNEHAPVVQKVNNAIHRTNCYIVDNAIAFHKTYPLDIDLHRVLVDFTLHCLNDRVGVGKIRDSSFGMCISFERAPNPLSVYMRLSNTEKRSSPFFFMNNLTNWQNGALLYITGTDERKILTSCECCTRYRSKYYILG